MNNFMLSILVILGMISGFFLFQSESKEDVLKLDLTRVQEQERLNDDGKIMGKGHVILVKSEDVLSVSREKNQFISISQLKNGKKKKHKFKNNSLSKPQNQANTSDQDRIPDLAKNFKQPISSNSFNRMGVLLDNTRYDDSIALLDGEGDFIESHSNDDDIFDNISDDGFDGDSNLGGEADGGAFIGHNEDGYFTGDYGDGQLNSGTKGSDKSAPSLGEIHESNPVSSELTIFVDNRFGNDDNDGSVNFPFATLEAASDVVNANNDSANVTIIISGGVESYDAANFSGNEKNSVKIFSLDSNEPAVIEDVSALNFSNIVVEMDGIMIISDVDGIVLDKATATLVDTTIRVKGKAIISSFSEVYIGA
ncbi:MAG: hypothetical protein ACI9F2_001114, partial [Lysobacterales bacterium]